MLSTCLHLQACSIVNSGYEGVFVEACVVERLTPRTPDLDILGSSLAHCVIFLDKKLYSTLSLFTQGVAAQVYKWVPATYIWGVTLGWTSIPFRGEYQYS